MKNAHEILCEKLDKEMSAFRASYNNMTTIQVYNDWYIIGFKEEFGPRGILFHRQGGQLVTLQKEITQQLCGSRLEAKGYKG